MQTVTAKSILNRTKHRDHRFLDDYTLNPFSGCSLNCQYCYIRGSKYGEHMERKVAVKENAVELLRRQLALRARKRQFGFIVLASATDPYLHGESDTQITRQLLEVILEFRFPVHLLTRSPRVERDLDLLERIDRTAIVPRDLEAVGHGALITFSFATTDPTIANRFEPGAPAPQDRLNALKLVASAGFKTGVSLMPLLPFISDTGELLERQYKQFRDHGAHYLFADTLTLFGDGRADSKTLVFRQLQTHYPELLPKYQKWFANGFGMPEYYRKALQQKTDALAASFGISTSPLPTGK